MCVQNCHACHPNGVHMKRVIDHACCVSHTYGMVSAQYYQASPASHVWPKNAAYVDSSEPRAFVVSPICSVGCSMVSDLWSVIARAETAIYGGPTTYKLQPATHKRPRVHHSARHLLVLYEGSQIVDHLHWSLTGCYQVKHTSCM